MNYRQMLSGCLKKQQRPLQKHLLPNGETVWVRTLARKNPSVYYAARRVIADVLFKERVFRPAFSGRRAAVHDEARRLLELAAAGICAPQLRAFDAHTPALMMSDLAVGSRVERLDKLLAQKDNSARLALWAEAVHALSDVHRREQYLNRAFARNILRDTDGGWHFFGFSEDPQMVLTLAECQARDCLLFVEDTARFFEENAAAAAAVWCKNFAGEADVVQRIFVRSLRALLHRRRLFHFIRYFGQSRRRHSLQLLKQILELSAAPRTAPAAAGRVLS